MGSLGRRTTFGLVSLHVILAVVLFVPAGTVYFWQAWVYLAVFVSAASSITIYLWRHDQALLERRVKAGPTAEPTSRQRMIQSVASVAFLSLLVVPALDHRLGWSHAPVLAVAAGNLLSACGFGVVFLVFRANPFTAGTVQVEPTQTVIDTGPYAMVRHPMYAGALLLLIGTPAALGSWWGLAAFPAILGAIVARLLDEERLLIAGLPGYGQYCARVRYRLIPRLW